MRLSGEKIKLSEIRKNVVRHSHECLATVIRMKMKLKLNSWERHETISRMSRATVPRYIFKIRSKFKSLKNVHSMRLQCESCVYIVDLCREIVPN